MTKEITRAAIIQEITDKFKLRELMPERFTFSEMVVPIYNVGSHLEHYKIQYSAVSVTSATHWLFFTVPMNERWVLSRYDVIFMGAGAHTVSGVFVRRIDGTPNSVYLDLTAAQSASYHVNLTQPAVLVAGDQIYILVDGYTSTQELRLYIDYMMEEVR